MEAVDSLRVAILEGAPGEEIGGPDGVRLKMIGMCERDGACSAQTLACQPS